MAIKPATNGRENTSLILTGSQPNFQGFYEWSHMEGAGVKEENDPFSQSSQ